MEHKIGIPAGCTATLKIEDGFAVITVEKKFKPKNGDFVKLLHAYHKEGKAIGIFKSITGKDHVDDVEYWNTDLHCGIDYGGKTCAKKCNFGQTSIEPATDAEKQQLLDALAAEGKKWNVCEKCIENIKWTPDIDEHYFSPCVEDDDLYDEWCYEGSIRDVDAIKKGLAFKTKKEAITAAEKMLNALKNK